MSLDYKSYLVQLAEADGHHDALSPDDKSVVERLLNHLEAHERSERDLLEDYRAAAEGLPDKGVRFVMGLILEDEERHHRLMNAMAQDVKSSLLWLGASPLPSITPTRESRDLLLTETVRFLEIEEQSADQLKELQKAVKNLHAGLLEVIVAGMETDTHKHIDMLADDVSRLGSARSDARHLVRPASGERSRDDRRLADRLNQQTDPDARIKALVLK